MTLQSHNLGSRGFLTLREHLDQIRAAVQALRQRHCSGLSGFNADVWEWLDDSIALHDVGKASPQFQQYIQDPEGFCRTHARDTKSHTPLSTVVASAFGCSERWEPQRAFAVA